MNNLTAKFIAGDFQNARQPDNKECTDRIELVARHGKELHNPVSVRCWMGRSSSASTVYACVWIRDRNGNWRSGKGQASGYGYHKMSAAVGDALRSAGVELYGNVYSNTDNSEAAKTAKKRAYINGVGESAVRSAMEAVAKSCGYRGQFLITGG